MDADTAKDVRRMAFIPRKTVHRLNCTGSSAVPAVMELAGVAGSIEDFCERVRRGLATPPSSRNESWSNYSSTG
jgi:hypothetical protein